MAKIHTLTYNGTKSSDLGVFVSGSGSFDAAEFDVDKYEIPGRNGDLILSNNRYKNIEITYPAFIPKAFMDKVQNVRNWLRSSKVYARLEDTYDMDHYRLGIPTGVQSFSPENRNDGANFEMTFDCKPQRFLKVGETPETVEADVQTETGEIVTFETVAESPITSASVSLSPIQSLNGYDSPWPAGGMVNKIPPTYVRRSGYTKPTATTSGNVITLTDYDAGGRFVGFNVKTEVGQKYTVKYTARTNVNGVQVVESDTEPTTWINGGQGVGINSAYTYTASKAWAQVWLEMNANNATITDLQFEQGQTATSWSPYSNICPISGHTGAALVRSGENMLFPSDFEQGSISGSGANTATNFRIRSAYIAVEPNTQYAFEIGDSLSLYEIHEYVSANGVGTKYTTINSATGTITTVSTTHYIRVLVRYSNNAAVDPSRVKAVQMRKGSATNLDEYSVTFTDQGTVYGGTYDFVTGKLVVKWKRIIADGVNVKTTGGYGPNGPLWLPAIVLASADYADPVASPAGTTSYLNWGMTNTQVQQMQNTIISGNGGRVIALHINDMQGTDGTHGYNSATEVHNAINAYLQSNPLEICYMLAIPLEYTLSPQQLTTLLGQNVVWGSGPITLTYAEPYNVENPTLFDARPLFTVTNPAEGDVIMVNGQAITFVDGYTGTVFIDCETMNAFSGAANLNSIIQATDFPVLVPGTNIVTWTGAGECTMTPRWWEL